MKKFNSILALFLCIIACGGLVVLFRGEKQKLLHKQSDINVSQDGAVDGVILDQESIKF